MTDEESIADYGTITKGFQGSLKWWKEGRKEGGKEGRQEGAA